MERGTYVAASGGLFQFRKLEIVNNNLANVNTPGFKKELLVADRDNFDQTLASTLAGSDPYAKLDHERTPGITNLRSVTDFTPGPIQYTGNAFDVALRDPNTFFVVGGESGQQYTRAGNFTVNANGELATQDGAQVQGDGGAIAVNGPGFSITPNGTVRVNGQQVGKLQIVKAEDTKSLERVGNSRFVARQGQAAPQAVESEVISGALEMSNVSAVNSMVDLIVTNRAFQMYTKSAEAIDGMNQTAINQIGRPR